VGWTQIIFGAVLVVVLLFVAVLYIVRQVIALRRLRAAEEMPLEEHAYLLGRARRRLVTSLLLLLLGVMLAVALIYLEAPAQALAEKLAAMREQGESAAPDPEQRTFTRFYLSFWIVFLLILMTVIFLAGWDYWATRRYGLRQHRKIIDDRRAMIEREISRLRQQRNGHP
jgi:hypothetical protein